MYLVSNVQSCCSIKFISEIQIIEVLFKGGSQRLLKMDYLTLATQLHVELCYNHHCCSLIP